MLFNATLTRVDAPVVNAGGSISFPTPGAAQSIRVCLDDPTSGQRLTIADLAIDVSGTLYIPASQLDSAASAASASDGLAFLTNAQVIVQVDGDAVAGTYMVRKVSPRRGAISHYECFLKAV